MKYNVQMYSALAPLLTGTGGYESGSAIMKLAAHEPLVGPASPVVAWHFPATESDCVKSVYM